LEKKDLLYCPDLSFSLSNEHLAGALQSLPNKVWNTNDWKLFKELGSDALSVAFSPDGKYVILGEGGFFNWRINIYDIEQFKNSNSYKLDWLLKKHLGIDRGDAAHSIDISQNQKYIAVGTNIGIYMLNAKWNPTSVKENPVIITEPLIFPNPADKTVNIRFNLLLPSEVSIGIFDINSRKVADIYNGFLEQGLQNFDWNISRVPSGTYFTRITAQGSTSTVKIIVNK
jgi:WD40 repeat protein